MTSYTIRALQWLRRLFGGTEYLIPEPDTSLLNQHQRLFRQARWGVIAIYLVQIWIALRTIPQWDGMIGREGMLPLWPVAWMSALPSETAISIVLGMFLGGSVLGLVGSRFGVCRIAAFIGLFQFVAWNNSYGKIGHSLHVLLFISFVLIFLPTGWHLRHQASRTIRQHTLFTFWAAQAVPLIAYSMAGLIKVLCGLWQAGSGQASVFGFEGLSRHVADRLLQTGSATPMGPWVIEHPWLVTPLMWFTLYLELFAFWALFRPSLRWIFVGGLVAFHVASYYTMTIFFPENMLLLVILMLCFPVTARKIRPTWGSFRELPLFHWLPVSLNRKT